MYKERIDFEFVKQLYSVGESGEGSLFLNAAEPMNLQLDFMESVLLEYKPKTILEIGTHKAGFDYFCCLCLPEVKITTIDIASWSKDAVKMVNDRFEDRVEHICGGSHETMEAEAFKNRRYEMAYVDGYHEYSHSLRDIMNCINITKVPLLLIDDAGSYVMDRVFALLKTTNPEYTFIKRTPDGDERKLTLIGKL